MNEKMPSERKFGLFFTLIFGVLAGYGVHKAWSYPLISLALFSSLSLVLITLFKPGLLIPLNKAWFQLGQGMGRITSPIVLRVVFYGLITPVALFLRILGRDELKLKPRSVDSYWIERQSPDTFSESFKHPF